MPNIKRANASGITKPGTAIADVPDVPTIGTATGGQAEATVTFTPATTGGTATTFTATSTPGSITGTAASSPITVSGLTNGTAYSFTVTATNSTGTSAASSASNQVTPVSLGDMDPIAMVEVGSAGAANITFSSIPSTYTHLQIRIIDRNDRSVNGVGGSIKIKFNSDSTSGNYRSHRLLGEPTSVYSSTYTGTSDGAIVSESMSNSATSGIFSASVIDILDYANTSKYKTVRTLGGGNTNTTSGDEVFLYSGLWQSTSAISAITLTVNPYNFTQYSHFALYGIKGA